MGPRRKKSEEGRKKNIETDHKWSTKERQGKYREDEKKEKRKKKENI